MNSTLAQYADTGDRRTDPPTANPQGPGVVASSATTFFIVDAFADRSYLGNPAAVIPDGRALSARQRQNLANELNVAVTSIVLEDERGWAIEWRTPRRELAFCGHATLAAAHILRRVFNAPSPICFKSAAGYLCVRFNEDRYGLVVPAVKPLPHCRLPIALEALSLAYADRVFETSTKYFVCLPHWVDVAAYEPDFGLLMRLRPKGLCITARGEGGVDFVSRYFPADSVIDEDYATGSTHAFLASYWGQEFGRDRVLGRQLSQRSACIECEVTPNAVTLWGSAVTTAQGRISVC